MKRLAVLVALFSTVALAAGTEARLDEASAALETGDAVCAGNEKQDSPSTSKVKDGEVTIQACSCGNGWYCNGMYLEYRASCTLSCCVQSRYYCARGCVNQPCGVADYCL